MGQYAGPVERIDVSKFQRLRTVWELLMAGTLAYPLLFYPLSLALSYDDFGESKMVQTFLVIIAALACGYLAYFAAYRAVGQIPLDLQLRAVLISRRIEPPSVRDRLAKGPRLGYFPWVRLPRILRPRSYAKSFLLFLSTVLLSAAYAILILQIDFSRYAPRIYGWALDLARFVPFGEVIFLVPFLPIIVTLVVGWAFAQPDAETVFRRPHERIFLFLRPFALEAVLLPKLTIGFAGLRRVEGLPLESVVSDEVSASGYLVAIGDPGETIPSLGALRSYFSDDEWQDNLQQWIDRAVGAAVIAASKHTVWEVEQFAKRGRLDELVFLIPWGPNVPPEASVEILKMTVGLFQATPYSDAVSKVLADRAQVLSLRLTADGGVEYTVSESPEVADYQVALRYHLAAIRGLSSSARVGKNLST